MLETDLSAAPAAIEDPKAISPSDLQFRGYVPGLDLLRGVAIAFVLVHHGIESRLPWAALHGPVRYLTYLASWGRTGVHLFFILSGFLITGILLDTKDRPD